MSHIITKIISPYFSVSTSKLMKHEKCNSSNFGIILEINRLKIETKLQYLGNSLFILVYNQCCLYSLRFHHCDTCKVILINNVRSNIDVVLVFYVCVNENFKSKLGNNALVELFGPDCSSVWRGI